MWAELICSGAQKNVFAFGTDQSGQELFQVAGGGLFERGTYHGPDASAKESASDIKGFGRVQSLHNLLRRQTIRQSHGSQKLT